LFVALKGERVDGHDFAAEAVRSGAVAALVAHDVGVPAVIVDDPLRALGELARVVLTRLPDLRLIGVTGSNGKTTTKDLIAQLLSTRGETVAAPGSYNGEIGLPLSVLRAQPTTRHLVLEYGARGTGHIRYLTEIARPDVGVVLGIGVAHLGEFGTRGAIAAAKRELVEALSSDGVAVLNADDPLVAAMAEQTPARLVTFGRDAQADVRAEHCVLDTQGRASFQLVCSGVGADVQLQLYGDHQVTNALAAAGAALQLDVSVADVAAALSAATPTSHWRMEVVETSSGVTVVNDAYNANPDSMAAALRALKAMSAGRRTWAVLGVMAELGDATGDAHRTIGRLAATLGISRVLAVGPVAAGVAESADEGRQTTAETVADADAAIRLLRKNVQAGDVVLVKASRSAGLERVAEALVEAVPA
jgi:UDP-N-acetylmuramoyl-tripeptide--D-alanyl-D-alanine ligase